MSSTTFDIPVSEIDAVVIPVILPFASTVITGLIFVAP